MILVLNNKTLDLPKLPLVRTRFFLQDFLELLRELPSGLTDFSLCTHFARKHIFFVLIPSQVRIRRMCFLVPAKQKSKTESEKGRRKEKKGKKKAKLKSQQGAKR